MRATLILGVPDMTDAELEKTVRAELEQWFEGQSTGAGAGAGAGAGGKVQPVGLYTFNPVYP